MDWLPYLTFKVKFFLWFPVAQSVERWTQKNVPGRGFDSFSRWLFRDLKKLFQLKQSSIDTAWLNFIIDVIDTRRMIETWDLVHTLPLAISKNFFLINFEKFPCHIDFLVDITSSNFPQKSIIFLSWAVFLQNILKLPFYEILQTKMSKIGM